MRMILVNLKFLLTFSLEREAAEEEMRSWIYEYLEEIQKIEIFFNTKFLEYTHEFEMLKHAFLKKKYGHLRGPSRNKQF